MILGKLTSTYNGEANEKYKWSQTTQDVTLQMTLPKKMAAKEVISTGES